MVKYWKISQEVIYGTYPKDIDLYEDMSKKINEHYGIKDGESLILIGWDKIDGGEEGLENRTKPQTEEDLNNNNFSYNNIKNLVEQGYNHFPDGKIKKISSQINNFVHDIEIDDKIVVGVGQYYFHGIGSVIQTYYEIEKDAIIKFGPFNEDKIEDDYYFRAIKIKWDSGWEPKNLNNGWELYETHKIMKDWLGTINEIKKENFDNFIKNKKTVKATPENIREGGKIK